MGKDVTMIDVMFYEAFEEEEKEIKKILPGEICAGFTPNTIQEHNEKIPQARLISIRTQSEIPMAWGQHLKGILARSQGYDHLSAFRRRSGKEIVYGYLGNYCARAVAEQAVLMMMALLRNLNKQTEKFHSFKRDGLTGRECKGQHVLVVGVGNIGREIVDIAKGLRMDVKGVDIVPTLKDLEYVPLEDGLGWADIVFCALPLTDTTEGMLNYDLLRSAKQGFLLVNIARGEITPVEDLKKLLEEGLLKGLALDVYPEENLLADALRAGRSVTTRPAQTILELANQEQVICTPHNAFNTVEALEQKASLTVSSVVNYLKNGTFPHPVPDG
jgi:D-lactate dehydrogenase